jgi:PIN domain nuclease of toxin-antitoxin system
MIHVVDTHGLVWFFEGDPRLGTAAKSVLNTSKDPLILPATVIAEACWIIEHGRTSIPSISTFFAAVDADDRFQITPLDRATIEKSNDLTAITEMHDRQIVATALLLVEKGEDTRLITHDGVITASGLVPIVW